MKQLGSNLKKTSNSLVEYFDMHSSNLLCLMFDLTETIGNTYPRISLGFNRSTVMSVLGDLKGCILNRQQVCILEV
jgi:hypothetical protein